MILDRKIHISVNVDVPSLSAYIVYLRERDQAKVDALTAQVQQLTAGLHQSNTGLEAADKENK